MIGKDSLTSQEASSGSCTSMISPIEAVPLWNKELKIHGEREQAGERERESMHGSTGGGLGAHCLKKNFSPSPWSQAYFCILKIKNNHRIKIHKQAWEQGAETWWYLKSLGYSHAPSCGWFLAYWILNSLKLCHCIPTGGMENSSPSSLVARALSCKIWDWITSSTGRSWT